MFNINVVQRNFDIFYDNGVKYVENRNLDGAIKSFTNALNCLVQIAENSSGALKQQKIHEVEELYDLIEKLEIKQEKQTEQIRKQNKEAPSIEKKIDPPQAKLEQKKENNNLIDVSESEFEIIENTNVTFNDIIGNDEIKDFVKDNWIDRYDPKYEAIYKDKYAPRLERGLLLYGLPGTGKTMLAQAIASAVEAVFFNIDASQIVDKYVGETEKLIKRLFDEASKTNRAIIFVDEIDSILALPNENTLSHQKSSLNQWLQMMDGFQKEKVSNLIIIGATNFPNAIAPSALRFGRIGKQFRVDLPTYALRKKMIVKQLPEDCFAEYSFDQLAKKTAGYTLNDLSCVCSRINLLRCKKMKKSLNQGITTNIQLTKNEVEQALFEQHSSVTEESIRDIFEFEKKYSISNNNGTIIDFYKKISEECK
jgi:transitional endoplasmic reticulum ATPase